MTDHFRGSHRGGHVVELSRYLERLRSPDVARLEQLYFGVGPEIFMAVAQQSAPDGIFANSMDMAVIGRVITRTLQRPFIVNYHEHAPEEEAFGSGRAPGLPGPPPRRDHPGSQFYEVRAPRPSEDGQTGRGLAGEADRAGHAAAFLRSLLFCVLLYDLNGSASLGAAGNADAGWL